MVTNSEALEAAKVKKIGANHGGSDEWYTPVEAVKPIMQFVKPNSKIWCPFDTKESNFYKLFKKGGMKLFAPI